MRKAEVSRTTAETALVGQARPRRHRPARQPDRRRLLRPHARPARPPRADRPRDPRDRRPARRRPPHRRGRRHRARPGARRGARRQARHPPLRRPATWRWTRRWCARRSTSRGGRSWSGRSTSRAPKIGSFDVELVREFFTALAMNARMTLNVALLDGANSHHIAEASFKAVARALRAAVEPDPRAAGAVPVDQGHAVGMTTVIVDYASGNLHSALKSFQRMADETGAGPVVVSRRPGRGRSPPTASCCPGSAPSPTAAPGSRRSRASSRRSRRG